MASSWTTNKYLERPGNGDYVDTWNIPVNGDMTNIDAAFGGVTNLNATSGNATLSSNVAVTANYINLALNITGAMSSNVTYTIPSGVGGTWVVRNATTDSTGGPWTVTIASAGGGSNVSVTRGRSTLVWSDGTNIRDVNENIPSIGTVTSVNVSGGTTGLTTSGGPITTNGTITIAGTLAITNGGTGRTTFGTGVQTALGVNVTGNGGMVLANGASLTNVSITTTTINSATINSTTINSATINSPIINTPNISTILNTGTLTLPTTTTTLVGTNTTNTLTNKNVVPRVNSAVSVTSPLAWNSDNFDEYQITALANSLTISADAGTPAVGQKIIFSITDDGNTQSLTWTTGTSKSFRAAGVELPVATVAGKVLYVGFIYNNAAARWDCVASSQEV